MLVVKDVNSNSTLNVSITLNAEVKDLPQHFLIDLKVILDKFGRDMKNLQEYCDKYNRCENEN